MNDPWKKSVKNHKYKTDNKISNIITETKRQWFTGECTKSKRFTPTRIPLNTRDDCRCYRQDEDDLKRSLPCHFQDGSTTDTLTDRQRN